MGSLTIGYCVRLHLDHERRRARIFEMLRKRVGGCAPVLSELEMKGICKNRASRQADRI